MTRTTQRRRTAARTDRGGEITGHQVTKNQGYQLPLPLWQALVEESARRKRLGLPLPSQNAIAIEAISEWLSHHKGRNS